MSLIDKLARRVLAVPKNFINKHEAVKGGKPDFTKMAKFAQNPNRIGKSIYWKTSANGQSVLATNEFSWSAGLGNYLDKKQAGFGELKKYSDEMQAVAFANLSNADADVRAAAGYILLDWPKDGCANTEAMGNALAILGKAQRGGYLIEPAKAFGTTVV